MPKVVKYSGETRCPKILADLAPVEASRVRLKGTGPTNAAAETSAGWSRYLSKYGHEESDSSATNASAARVAGGGRNTSAFSSL
jgi:hypothetical protein